MALQILRLCKPSSLGRFECMYNCVCNVMHPMVLHVSVGSQNLTTRFCKIYLYLCSRTLFGTAHNLQKTLIVLPTFVKEAQCGFLEHWKIK